MPFIKSTPSYKLSNKKTEVCNSIQFYDKYKEAISNIEYWTEFLNKGTLTIEQQRKCLNLIEEEELERDINYSNYKQSLK
jgi:hypothetical protein